MAFNYSKLRGRIIEKFGTQSTFAKYMKMSERTLSLKLNGKIYFVQNEILLACELLELTKDDIQAYFFNQEVQ